MVIGQNKSCTTRDHFCQGCVNKIVLLLCARHRQSLHLNTTSMRASRKYWRSNCSRIHLQGLTTMQVIEFIGILPETFKYCFGGEVSNGRIPPLRFTLTQERV